MASDDEVDFEDDDEYRMRRAQHDKKKRQAEKVRLSKPMLRVPLSRAKTVDDHYSMSDDSLTSV